MRWSFFLIFPMALFAGNSVENFSQEKGTFGSWAEKVLSEMTLEEKVGQLFAAPGCPLRGEDHKRDWEALLKECHMGALLVKQSDAASQIHFLNELQDRSTIPLLVLGDDEWGLAMTMKDAAPFPRNMTLGALQDRDLLFAFGKEVGKEALLAGVHLNLAPVADVNSNPKNPIIHMRSFGDDPLKVAECVTAVIEGMRASCSLSCVKHFPGHGDTIVDSHLGLPKVERDLEGLHFLELYPFKRAIEAGVDAVMTGHLLTAIDPDLPATLSEKCIQGLLREEMRFDGLIVTDALNMRGLDAFSVEEVALLAKKAGADILLYGSHILEVVDHLIKDTVPRAFRALVSAYKEGELPLEELDRSVLRILRAKEKALLPLKKNVDAALLFSTLKGEEALFLRKELFEKAILGENFAVDFSHTLYIALDGGIETPLAALFPHRIALSSTSDEASGVLRRNLKNFDSFFVSIHRLNVKEENCGYSLELLRQLEEISPKAVVAYFQSPYSFNLLKNAKGKILAFENDPHAISAVAELLLGKKTVEGKMPVSLEQDL